MLCILFKCIYLLPKMVTNTDMDVSQFIVIECINQNISS